jgi:hypothetical protein
MMISYCKSVLGTAMAEQSAIAADNLYPACIFASKLVPRYGGGNTLERTRDGTVLSSLFLHVILHSPNCQLTEPVAKSNSADAAISSVVPRDGHTKTSNQRKRLIKWIRVRAPDPRTKMVPRDAYGQSSGQRRPVRIHHRRRRLWLFRIVIGFVSFDRRRFSVFCLSYRVQTGNSAPLRPIKVAFTQAIKTDPYPQITRQTNQHSPWSEPADEMDTLHEDIPQYSFG